MPRGTAAILTQAKRGRSLIRLSSRFEQGWASGYVVDIGPRWLMLALVNDGMRFNGFQCYRLADLRRLKVPDPYALFCEAALRKRRERLPSKRRVSVESIEHLLRSANSAFPLLAVHREKIKPGACQIGRVVAVGAGRLWLQEITPGAKWDTVPWEYRLADITRIDFGGAYEEALHLVGGDPPVVKPGFGS